MCGRLSKVVACVPRSNRTFVNLLQLVKETQIFEHLSVDFKGPLPSSTKNRYLLTIVDEYSRFPFAFPCASVVSKIVIAHFNQLFALFDMPAYIHSGRGAVFMSNELTMFLRRRGIACSRTSVYTTPGNGQCECYHGIISTAIKSRKLGIAQRECVLPDALHFHTFSAVYGDECYAA